MAAKCGDAGCGVASETGGLSGGDPCDLLGSREESDREHVRGPSTNTSVREIECSYTSDRLYLISWQGCDTRNVNSKKRNTRCH